MICKECPRRCGALRRSESGGGVCGVGVKLKISKVMLHKWEEPCISGTNGSGAVFFSGCNLKCAFCQNSDISFDGNGKYVSREEFSEIINELKSKGAHNINLVTPSHYAHTLADIFKENPGLPVVYNCGGYESIRSLKELNGKVQIYLADFKYALSFPAEKYSSAADYPEICEKALEEMYNQVGDFELDENGLMKKGLIVRHLVLPGNLENSKRVIDVFMRLFGGKRVMLSLMGQYTPHGKVTSDIRFSEINKKVSRTLYTKVCDYAAVCGVEYGYFQDISSANEKYIPDFNIFKE